MAHDDPSPSRRREPGGAPRRVLAMACAVVLLVAAGGCIEVDDSDESDDASDGATTTTTVDEESAELDVPDVVRGVQPSIVAVVTDAGEGSGVVYDTDGLVVTNAHVIGEATEAEVLYADGRTAQAEVVGRDPWLDIALLRSGRTDVEGADFADDLPEVGEAAIAMGNPLGFENSVTLGIISGLERSIPGGGPPLVGLIQTDAAISPGNSGGALVNADAEVVGINIAYLPPQAGAVSLGFAVPAPLVVDAAEELAAEGAVSHPYLGIGPLTLTSQMADRFDIDAEAGVVAVEVASDGPAARAGIEPGDVLVEMDDTSLETVEDLFAAMRDLEGGDTVAVSVIRGSETISVDVQLGTRPADSTG